MIRIIEQQAIGKKSQEACEDGIVATDSFVAVIDGSTSKTAISYHPTMSNGRFAMTEVCRLIAEDLPANASVETFCDRATQRLHQCYTDCHADLKRLEEHPVERTTCSAVVYNTQRRELWMVGDCQVLNVTTGEHYENNKPYEEPIAEIRAAHIRLALLDGATTEEYRVHDKGRETVLPLLRYYCKYQDVTYPVIDGFPIPMHTVKVIKVPDTTKELILASDGYPTLCPTLEASERHLADLLATDPLLTDRVKATKGWMKGNKSFDDRAYIRFCIQ